MGITDKAKEMKEAREKMVVYEGGGWRIDEHAGREQPYTVWFDGRVAVFKRTRDEAMSYIQGPLHRYR